MSTCVQNEMNPFANETETREMNRFANNTEGRSGRVQECKEAQLEREALQHTATHCNALQYTATHSDGNTLQHTANQGNTQRRTALKYCVICSIIAVATRGRSTATQCNTL